MTIHALHVCACAYVRIFFQQIDNKNHHYAPDFPYISFILAMCACDNLVLCFWIALVTYGKWTLTILIFDPCVICVLLHADIRMVFCLHTNEHRRKRKTQQAYRLAFGETILCIETTFWMKPTYIVVLICAWTNPCEQMLCSHTESRNPAIHMEQSHAHVPRATSE